MELGQQLVQERQNREAALATIARMETTLGAVRQAGARGRWGELDQVMAIAVLAVAQQ